MGQRQYFKVTSDWDEDERIAPLSDAEQLVWIKTLSRAKRQRPGGYFGSLQHLRALLPDRMAKHLAALLKAGLLTQEPDGRISVTNWARYQIDPTSAARKARWNEARGTVLVRSDPAKERTETRDVRQETRDLTKKNISKTGMKSAFEIIVGGTE